MMAGYRFNKEEYFKETKEVYSNYPTDVSRMEEELDRLQKENPKASSFQKKTWIYRIAARDAEVILFPSSPFYAEIDTGREQFYGIVPATARHWMLANEAIPRFCR